MSKVYHSG